MFWCPGCNQAHVINVGPTPGPNWTWNNNVDSPTFSPSILIRSGHYSVHHTADDNCWCTYNQENPDNPTSFKCRICHSFVVDGNIQFLTDCTHELAGQTVPLPPIHD